MNRRLNRLVATSAMVVTCGLTIGGAFAPASAADRPRVGPIDLRPAAQAAGNGTAILGISFAPDGQTLVSGGKDRLIRLRRSGDLGEIRQFAGHIGNVHRLIFTPDGATLLSCSRDGSVRAWDVATGTQKWVVSDHQGPTSGLAMTPDGRSAAASDSSLGRGSVIAIDVDTGKSRTALPAYTTGANALTFAPDGKLLATASDDSTVRLWDFASGAPRAVIKGPGRPIIDVEFAPDGQSLAASATDFTVRVFATSTGEERHRIAQTGRLVSPVEYSPDGALLVTSDRSRVHFWETGRWSEVGSVDIPQQIVTGVAFAPDGKTVAMATFEGQVRTFTVVPR